MLADVIPTGIPLRDKFGEVKAWALVDTNDVPAIGRFKWYLGSHGYATRKPWNNGRPFAVLMHRYILGLERGDPLEGDHINWDRLDNRRCNLRVVTRAENSLHQRRVARGVHHFRTGKWQAYVNIEGRRKHLGYFHSEAAALGAVAEAKGPRQMDLWDAAQ